MGVLGLSASSSGEPELIVEELEVDHCTRPSLQLSIPSSLSILFAHPHVILGAPSFTSCLHSFVSCTLVHGRRGKSISQVPAPLCKSAFIELLESDMTRFSCIDGVAAQNAENGAGGGKAQGCAREESCSWLIFSQCCCCKMKLSFVCCWCRGGGATSQRYGPLTIFHSSGTIMRFFTPPPQNISAAIQA